MLSVNYNQATIPVSANADKGTVAVPSRADFGLQSTLDAGRTVRSNRVVGGLTIAHQSSREFGGATRHLLSFELNQNGDREPAKAQLVIVAKDSEAGAQSGIDAFLLLLAALTEITPIQSDTGEPDYLDFQAVLMSGDSDVRSSFTLETPTGTNPKLGHQIRKSLYKVLNGEG